MKRRHIVILLIALVVAMLYPTFYYFSFEGLERQYRDWPDDGPTIATYYDGQCRVPWLALGMDAEYWLRHIVWADDYKANEWDCSTRSAYLEWLLENCGVHTLIGCGDGHAWNWVLIDNEWKLYDSGTRDFASQAEIDKYYSGWHVWESLHDVHEDNKIYGTGHFVREWGWWAPTPFKVATHARTPRR